MRPAACDAAPAMGADEMAAPAMDAPPSTSLQPGQLTVLVCFSAISSTLLLVNKLTLNHIPLPALVSTLQFVVASGTCLVLKATGLAVVDDFEWAKVKPYLLYVCLFGASIFTNMKVLELATVETIIVFRSALPLLVSLLDAAFLGRHLPSRRSCATLLVVAGGATAYALTDDEFRSVRGVRAYGWALVYFVVLSVEMAYGKHIVGPHLGLKSMWGPVMYTNTLAAPLMLAVGVATGETRTLAAMMTTTGKEAAGLGTEAEGAGHDDDGDDGGGDGLLPSGARWDVAGVLLLLLSCVFGTAISYFGFRARKEVTATCFTVVGVLNKMITVLANLLLSAQHASPAGILSLLVCILAATCYQPSPLRSAYLVPLKGDVDAAEAASEMELEPVAPDRGEQGGGSAAMRTASASCSS